jgi:hypothetical protein
MEVMRDKADNCVIICSIENFDPMGVHTGDSITVAPTQTLTDKEFQIMRDASFAVIRAVGVETGGSNIQFAVNPDNGRMVIIEMNPRVSRSSALASKATGFPIAKIAAKLAVGYLLDEIRNDITRETPASFEPTIDYVVTKIPRFAFEKFPQADPTLNTQMKSVGEAMAIGRTFKESLQKALRSLEIGRHGLGGDGKPWRMAARFMATATSCPRDIITQKLIWPNAERIFFIRHAMRAGFSIDEIYQLTKIDRWFLAQIKEIVDFEEELAHNNLYSLCCEEISRRFATFYRSFAMVMNAQITISTINTVLTGIFVAAMGLPHLVVAVGLTFLCGFLPVIGNLISNSLVVALGFIVSPEKGLWALAFLVLVHKLEYFLNSKIIGSKIHTSIWLTLLALMVGERLMGITGMVLAPVVLHYIQMEASKIPVNSESV